MHFLYLHGFASSPASHKAVFFKERLSERGVSLTVPDLNQPDFEHLTVSRSLGQVDALVPEGEQAVILGSSFGGYTAALFATRYPERVAALVLLAPAFNLARILSDRHGPEAMRRWEQAGSAPVEHPSFESPQPLAWDFQADAERWAATRLAPRCPTLILHGIHDDEVPVAGSRALAAGNPEVVLVELDDDHRLLGRLDRVWDETSRFLAPWLPEASTPSR